MTTYIILGLGVALAGLYGLYQRSLRLREVERRVAAEAQREALKAAHEALFKRATKNKAEIRDAVKKAQDGDYSSLFTIS